jgi:hypothetical protein
MRSGPTKPLDYEKAKRQKTTQNADYQQRFAEEGNNFDRGGKARPKVMSLRGSTLVVHLEHVVRDDKANMVQMMEHHWKFVVNGEVGTIAKLRKSPKVGQLVEESFEIMRHSILRADTSIGVADNPTDNTQCHLVEFRCPLRPLDPYPNPVFKDHLAFSVKLVGRALTEPQPKSNAKSAKSFATETNVQPQPEAPDIKK